MGFRFAHPWFLLLLLLPLAVLIYRAGRGGIAFGAYNLARATLRRSLGPLIHRGLVALGLAALVLALARPQYGRSIEVREQRGRDIMLIIDLSFSMIADDMENEVGDRITRLDAVAAAARHFIEQRPDDRIGLVFFAEDATTSCPLTYDHSTVLDFLAQTRERQHEIWQASLRKRRPTGILGNGTNLGLGVGIALRRLEEENPEGRAALLITDGRDSRELRNWVDPLEAARHAENMGVRVHAIGVGDPQGYMTDIESRMYGVNRLVHVPRNFLPDMGRLHEITSITGGITEHADDRDQIEAIFASIEDLAPTPRQVTMRPDYTDRFLWPLIVGAVLMTLAVVFEPRLRGVP